MLLHYLFILGICVEAVTGALAAGRKQMDIFGVIMIACITALGGGTVRDILFATYPLTWVENPHYLLITALCAVFTIVLARSLHRVLKVFLVLDALGLATFVILGTEKMLSLGFGPSNAVISGMLTGISGGMLRDILCNDIPLVLRKELYATIALVGAMLFTALSYWQVSHLWIVVIPFFSVFVLRLIAIFWHLEVPKFDYGAKTK